MSKEQDYILVYHGQREFFDLDRFFLLKTSQDGLEM